MQGRKGEYNIAQINKQTTAEIKQYSDSNLESFIIGCLMRDTSLLTRYKISEIDFTHQTRQSIFMGIKYYALHEDKIVTPIDINDYLETNYPARHQKFQAGNGLKYLEACIKLAHPASFSGSYEKFRKWSLLRQLLRDGQDVKEICDIELYNSEDLSIRDTERKRFAELTLEDILIKYDNKQQARRFEYDINSISGEKLGGQEALKQLEVWKDGVAFGHGYASGFLTDITYGLKPGKLHIMSAPTGVGKTRVALANMCYAFAPEFFNTKNDVKKWVLNPHGQQNSALFISTEMEVRSEIEPIVQAYMSGVPEPHIKKNDYMEGEEEKIIHSVKKIDQYYIENKNKEGEYIKDYNKCGIYVEYLPDFKTEQLKGLIHRYKEEHNISVVFFDYIQSTPSLYKEYQGLSGGSQFREDQVLLYLATILKQIAQEENICIVTATQTNEKCKTAKIFDETCIRGSKAIADKGDVGMILTRMTKPDLDIFEQLKNVQKSADLLHYFKTDISPTHCLTVYKNRGGNGAGIRILLNIDYETMRISDVAVTNAEGDELLRNFNNSMTALFPNGKKWHGTLKQAEEQNKAGYLSDEDYLYIQGKLSSEKFNDYVIKQQREAKERIAEKLTEEEINFEF